MPETAQWPPAKRIGFRFLFVYLVLYSFPFPLDYIPIAHVLAKPWNLLWKALVPPVAKSVFHTTARLATTGSGDMTWNYVQVACLLVFAVIITVIWSLLDRRRANYVRLHRYLHAWVRLVLAAAMLAYGIAKLIPPTQFPPPTLDRLVETYGASSPMGILWAFMGTSRPYTMLAGASELLGGVLLVSRRTALLGALVSIGVMGNIVALNFSYDVPVKLYSFHLLMMGVFVAAPDAGKLIDFFLRRPAAPLFEKRWAHIDALVLRTLLVIVLVWVGVDEGLQGYRELSTYVSPLRGIWNIDVLDVGGIRRPPLVTDTTRWRRIVFDYPDQSSIYLMSDERVRYATKLDPKTRTIRFTGRFDPNDVFTLTYLRPDPKSLQLDGIVSGHTIHAVCTLADEKKFLLTSRGFHWINERPFNR